MHIGIAIFLFWLAGWAFVCKLAFEIPDGERKGFIVAMIVLWPIFLMIMLADLIEGRNR